MEKETILAVALAVWIRRRRRRRRRFLQQQQAVAPRYRVPYEYNRHTFDLDSWPERKVLTTFRFSTPELYQLWLIMVYNVDLRSTLSLIYTTSKTVHSRQFSVHSEQFSSVSPDMTTTNGIG
ncbi:hypothetical protein WAI453_007367 [Rhynchosporium graminicola]